MVRKNQKGFTITELVLYLTISTVLVTAMVQFFMMQMNTLRVVDDSTDVTSDYNKIFNLISKDIYDSTNTSNTSTSNQCFESSGTLIITTAHNGERPMQVKYRLNGTKLERQEKKLSSEATAPFENAEYTEEGSWRVLNNNSDYVPDAPQFFTISNANPNVVDPSTGTAYENIRSVIHITGRLESSGQTTQEVDMLLTYRAR